MNPDIQEKPYYKNVLPFKHPEELTPARVAESIGFYGPGTVEKACAIYAPEWNRGRLRSLQETHKAALLEGKRKKGVTCLGDGRKKEVHGLQGSPIKQICRQVVVESFAAPYAGRTPKQPLRWVSLPGPGFTTEQLLLKHPKLGASIGEIISIEDSLIKEVQAKAAQLAKTYPAVKFTTFKGDDADFLGQNGVETLRPQEGVNAIWLDGMASYDVGIKRKIQQLLAIPGLFARAWAEGAPGIFWLTIKPLRDRVVAREELKQFAEGCPEITLHQGEHLGKHYYRIAGISSLMYQTGLKNGLICRPLKHVIYRHTDSQGGTMLMLGFEILPYKGGFPPRFTVEATRITPKTVASNTTLPLAA